MTFCLYLLTDPYDDYFYGGYDDFDYYGMPPFPQMRGGGGRGGRGMPPVSIHESVFTKQSPK